jgi:hypothetical protein|uniref:Uncharacterized protein n=1 Tax=Siphoviridae sp. cteoh1 TaxID=2826407 RepID=A0A8S5QL82_9CAUD|nr:MAG TPA: hypothetical protein [Siphoviridae sp. cteoh1]
MYIAMLPGIDGWTELSDAQQSFIEQSIRNQDVNIFDAGSMSR